MGLALNCGCMEGEGGWNRSGARASNDSAARRPVEPAATASSGVQPAPAAGTTASAEDQKAASVNSDVAAYVDAFPEKNDPFNTDDLNSKTDRQSDPQVQGSSQQAVRTAYEGPVGSGNQRPAGNSIAVSPPAQPSEGNATPETANNVAGAGNAPAASSSGMNAMTVDASPAKPAEPGSPGGTAAGSTTPTRPPVLASIQVETGDRPNTVASDTNAGAPGRLIPVTDGNQSASSVKPVSNEVPRPAAPEKAANPAEMPSLANRIAELERRVSAEPNGLEDQFRLRMLYLVDGQDEKALAPTAGMNSDVQDIVLAHVRTLMAARSGAGRDPATWANRQLETVESLSDLIRTRADLQVPRVILCTATYSFGQYDPIKPAVFTTGRKNPVIVYVEVKNFATEKLQDERYRILLSMRYSLLDAAGAQVFSQEVPNIKDEGFERRRDFYFSLGPLQVPPDLPVGEYTFKVEVEDEIGGKINSNVARFKVVSPTARIDDKRASAG